MFTSGSKTTRYSYRVFNKYNTNRYIDLYVIFCAFRNDLRSITFSCNGACLKRRQALTSKKQNWLSFEIFYILVIHGE